MTNKEALAYLTAAQSHTHKLSSGYAALDRAIKALEASIKAETEESRNIPLEEIRAEIGWIKDTITDLQTSVYILERKAKL